jgi:hypothetical protein
VEARQHKVAIVGGGICSLAFAFIFKDRSRAPSIALPYDHQPGVNQPILGSGNPARAHDLAQAITLIGNVGSSVVR